MIISTQNDQVKNLLKLRKVKERKSQNLIIIEGYKEISMAIAGGTEILKLYFSKDLANSKTIPELEKVTEEMDKKVFAKVSYRENPDGFLALGRPRILELTNLKLGAKALLIVLESVEKPGNLGAILRTADAARADGVIICAPQTDIYNPNVVRASLGTVFTNQVVVSSNETVIKWLQGNKIQSFASTPRAKKVYTDVDYSGPSAIVIGTEHDGLSDEWLNQADYGIRIPMHGRIDSLNASVSAAIVLYEAIRQRA
jgi:TrmH family RNA methyltransferase